MRNYRDTVDITLPLAACDDGVLIQMAINGRSDCFSALMDRHLVAVRRRMRLMVSNEADLDDLLQEVSLKVWRHLKTFRSDSSIRTWMVRIGLNQARQFYRHRHCRPICQPLEDFGTVASPAESPHQSLLRAEATHAVRMAVATLPVHFREVVTLRDLNEMRGKETAEHLQTTLETVKTRLFRARMMLSRKLRNSGYLGHNNN